MQVQIIDKIKFHLKVIRITIIRNLLGLIGLFTYPFINKEKARTKKNFWWLLLNDDELKNGVDYDVKMVEEKGIPKWFASYWFNAIRNRAYNYLLSRYPKETALNVDDYEILEGDKKAMEWKGGTVWFLPNPHTDKISCRISFKGLKYGDFGDRYDIKK